MSEVQDAVAQEAQSGFSSTHADSSTTSGGAGLGLSLGPLTLGTASGSSTSSDAQQLLGVYWVTEPRGIHESEGDGLHPAGGVVVRNRRASIVKEVLSRSTKPSRPGSSLTTTTCTH